MNRRSASASSGLLGRGLQCGRRGEPLDLVREPAPGLVLRPEDADQIDEGVGLLEPREELVLLELLVVVLDEPTDDAGRADQNGRVEVSLAIQTAHRFVVDQEHAVQDTVLTHQVLGRRDFLFFLPGVGRRLVLCPAHARPRGEQHPHPASQPEKAPARVLSLPSHDTLPSLPPKAASVL